MTWRPIETAPVDAWVVVKGFKMCSHDWGAAFDTAPSIVVAMLDSATEWVWGCYQQGKGLVFSRPPTHWQPLPAPPEDRKP
jgi:hypothetical protein